MHLTACYPKTAATRAAEFHKRAPRRTVLDFISPVRNFLDIANPGFHYSAIGHFATIGRAIGIAEHHPLNDEVPASTGPVADAISYVRADHE